MYKFSLVIFSRQAWPLSWPIMHQMAQWEAGREGDLNQSKATSSVGSWQRKTEISWILNDGKVWSVGVVPVRVRRMIRTRYILPAPASPWAQDSVLLQKPQGESHQKGLYLTLIKIHIVYIMLNGLPIFCVCFKTESLPFQNNLKNLDPSCKVRQI